MQKPSLPDQTRAVEAQTKRSPIKIEAFLLRSESKTVFVLVMTSYALAAAALLRNIATVVGAPPVLLGTLLMRGQPVLEVISLVVLAPVTESLILIGSIELLRWLRSPVWLQLICSATILIYGERPVSHALSVAPGWFIMSAAYLMWRGVSWKVGFGVIVSIHVLLNLNRVIWTIGYAIRHAHA